MATAISVACKKIDGFIQRTLLAVCVVLILSMIVFTSYTVIMRYFFSDPPFWGDTVTVFANVWYVMLAAAITTRKRENIAMKGLYAAFHPKFGLWLELLWNATVLFIALFLLYGGVLMVMQTPGAYWELNMLPKKVPIAIIPICGFFLMVAAAYVLVEDVKDLGNSLK